MGKPRKWQTNPMLQNLVQTARQADPPLHWLDLQDANRYRWQKVIGQSPATSGRVAYYRRLGVVEGLFDSDGTLSCGRADLHQIHTYEIRTSLSNKQLCERIVLAWTLMRASHVLLSSQTMFLDEIVPRAPSRKWTEKCFLYRCPRSSDEAIEEAQTHVRFLGNSYQDVDVHQFYLHILNTNRAIDPKTALSRLHVLPFRRTSHDTVAIHFIPVVAHQISDGLTVYRWATHFARILNMSESKIKTALTGLLHDPETSVPARLPPSQESLYPIRSPNLPRQRWHWLITRILRHVRHPPPAGFPNPLLHTAPQRKSSPLTPTFSQVLDYSTTPPLNAGHVSAIIQHPHTQTLRTLCKKSHISIGSGLFTLVALTMMALEERLNPSVPLEHRPPFVGSFPVNPRPFLTRNTTGTEDSCMLAFSDGVTLPFLPSHLDFAGRFAVLGRLAHRQLRQYQKRPQSLDEEVHLGSRSPSQLLPALYCGTLERLESRYTDTQKSGVNVQGAYPVRTSAGPATCGVSSVGDVASMFVVPAGDTSGNTDEQRDLSAELESVMSCVRPRDGEFLVGAIGDSRRDQLTFSVSFDANAIDAGRVGEWKGLMERVLEGVEVNLASGDEDPARAKL